MKNDTQKRFKPKPAKPRRTRTAKGKKAAFRTADAHVSDAVYEGVVKDGVVHLQNGATLKDGTRVNVEPQSPAEDQKKISFAERYREFIGAIKGMPADFAENHDHYIHGTPKRK